MTKFRYIRSAAFAVLAGGLIVAAVPASAHDRHDRDATTFSITLDGVQFGYSDGYYDNDRRWHSWRSHNERAWYRRHHRDSYYHMGRHRDRDRYRRDWRHGRRDDWRGDGRRDGRHDNGRHDNGRHDNDRRSDGYRH
jgi:hypothetical protein